MVAPGSASLRRALLCALTSLLGYGGCQSPQPPRLDSGVIFDAGNSHDGGDSGVDAGDAGSPLPDAGLCRGCVLLGGRPMLRIIDPRSAHPVMQDAMTDLGAYLTQVSGTRLSDWSGPGRLEVLETIPLDAPEELRRAPEGYWIDVRGQTIRIVGGSPIGTAYGVYRFLEKHVGVRWFLPVPEADDDAGEGEYVPSLSELVLPEGSEFSKPHFAMRWMGDGRWGLRNGSNHIRGSKERMPDGGLVSAGFRMEPAIYHTLDTFVPLSRYFKADGGGDYHPEYFALVDGGRQNFGPSTKLSTGDSEVVRVVAENMGDYLDQHPGVDVINLSPTDLGGFCECSLCTALDEQSADGGVLPVAQRYSRRMWVFYSEVVAALRAPHPRAQVAVGAYWQYTMPPRDVGLTMPRGVGVVLAHFTPACLAHPVNDSTCKANESYRNAMLEWTARGAEGIYFYEYYRKMAWFGLPWPIVHSIKADIPYFATLGTVNGLYSQTSEENGYTHGLNYYVAAKLLWNPAADVEALVTEFYQKYYLESAGPVFDYHRRLEARMAAVSPTDSVDGTAWNDALFVFDLPFIAQLEQDLTRAAQLARGKTVGRVARLQKSLSYARRLVEGLTLRRTDRAAACQKLTDLTIDCRDNRASWSGLIPLSECAYLGRALDKIAGCSEVGGVP